MKIRSILVVPLFIAALCAACGKRDSQPASAPATDAAAAAGIPVEPSAQPPATIGPEGFPACPDLLAVKEQAGNSREGSALLTSSQPVPKMLEFFTVQLSANGWYIANSARHDAEYHFEFAQGEKFVRLQFSPVSESNAAPSQLRMAWGMSAVQAESLESQAPEEEEDIAIPEPPSNEW